MLRCVCHACLSSAAHDTSRPAASNCMAGTPQPRAASILYSCSALPVPYFCRLNCPPCILCDQFIEHKMAVALTSMPVSVQSGISVVFHKSTQLRHLKGATKRLDLCRLSTCAHVCSAWCVLQHCGDEGAASGHGQQPGQASVNGSGPSSSLKQRLFGTVSRAHSHTAQGSQHHHVGFGDGAASSK